MSVEQQIEEAPIIKCDNVAEYYFMSDQTDWGDDDFPNVAPPFPVFKITYTIPPKIVLYGKTVNNPNAGIITSTLVQSVRVEEGEIIHRYKAPCNGWYVYAHTVAGQWEFVFDYFCDTVGCFKKGNNNPTSVMIRMENIYGDSVKTLSDIATMLLQPILLAISFMHCKNVTATEVDPNVQLSRQVRRQMERKNMPPLEKYYVLNIEPLKQTLRTEGREEGEGLKRALHICRGHFKNFATGNGLFGKYKGLFWWEQHVRGEAKSGQIKKEYNIKI